MRRSQGVLYKTTRIVNANKNLTLIACTSFALRLKARFAPESNKRNKKKG